MFTFVSSAVICALLVGGNFVTFAQFESPAAASKEFREFLREGRVQLAEEGRSLADRDIGIVELRCRAQQ